MHSCRSTQNRVCALVHIRSCIRMSRCPQGTVLTVLYHPDATMYMQPCICNHVSGHVHRSDRAYAAAVYNQSCRLLPDLYQRPCGILPCIICNPPPRGVSFERSEPALPLRYYCRCSFVVVFFGEVYSSSSPMAPGLVVARFYFKTMPH